MAKILLPTPDAPPKLGGVARYIGATARARNDIEIDALPESWGTMRVFLHLFRHSGESRNPAHRENVGPRVEPGVTNIWTHHIFPVGTVCYLLSFISPLSYTVFLHGLDFDLARRNVWKRFLARRILKGASGIVANSVSLQKEVSAFVHRDDIQIVYPCVSAEFTKASETVRKGLAHRTPEELAKLFMSQMVAMTGSGISASRHLGMTNPVRLLTVARLVERKGHAKVLRAMVDIPKITYTIIGDGPMRESLKKEAEELGVADRVSFLTEVTDEQLPELYAAHDIFVMPTTKSERDREGFGIVYAEAGLFGLPCIATDIPGVDEVVLHEVTGMLIQDTPHALSEALKKLAASPGLRSRMGTAARKYILENFTEERFREAIGKVR
ncbi:MAG: glycosyltransferase family 4 protein, partial [Patescibacteria group bacterium]